jgi:AraC-like DNA-binding protein
MTAPIAFAEAASERPASAAVRFSTADYAPRDRLTAWREVYGRTMLKIDVEPIETEAFHTDVAMRKLPGLGIMTGSRSAAVYQRNRHDIDNDDLVVSIGLSGAFETAQLGRTATMAQGDAVVLASAEHGVVKVSSSGPWINLCVPARAITGLSTHFCQRIPADNTALRLLTQYVGILEEADTLEEPDLQRHAITHIHDLIALAAGASHDVTEIARARGARAARLRAIKADVTDNLARDDLSAATVAARHRLPVRYVQRLFETEGTTFTDFVLDARLAHAHRMLTNARFANLKISAVACEAGFGDPSYFNRSFRRRYGATPSDVRAQIKADS